MCFHLIFYNVDIYGDVVQSLQHNKKELIEKYGKKSVECDTYFLSDEFDLSTFPKETSLLLS